MVDNTNTRETTSIRIDPVLWHRAKVYAIQHRMNVGEFVENLIKKELEKKK